MKGVRETPIYHTLILRLACKMPKFLSSPNNLGITAVGFSGGQCKTGVDAAPQALIESGLIEALRDKLGYKLHFDQQVHIYSDVIPENDDKVCNMLRSKAVSAVTSRIAEQVYAHAKEGRMVLNLGGDHSIAIGTIGGTARAVKERLNKEMAVVWIDAHADINTPETSDSGNIHGMPVAFLTGIAKSKREYDGAFSWIQAHHQIPISKLVYVGLRDVDDGERQILKENGIVAFSMHSIDRWGIGQTMEKVLAHIGRDTPIYLSFDVDSLDPSVAPSTGTPVRGGLTLREGDFICEVVHETGQLVGMDLVEVNPHLETHGSEETVRVGASIVRCALGEVLL